jgi:hypothetical protein
MSVLDDASLRGPHVEPQSWVTAMLSLQADEPAVEGARTPDPDVARHRRRAVGELYVVLDELRAGTNHITPGTGRTEL